MDTNFNDGFYGPSGYGQTYHFGDTNLCAGDPLISGQVRVMKNGKVKVELEGANQGNLYEVYFLPIGGDPTPDGDLLYLGSILTGPDGTPVSKIVRRATTPKDALSPSNNVKLSDVGSPNQTNSGHFLFYSRGPYATAGSDDEAPVNFNTSDGTEHGTFNNPLLWGGNTNMYDGVQFVSE
jgi:hypothetical protein